jgi:hypothetical protein
MAKAAIRNITLMPASKKHIGRERKWQGSLKIQGFWDIFQAFNTLDDKSLSFCIKTCIRMKVLYSGIAIKFWYKWRMPTSFYKNCLFLTRQFCTAETPSRARISVRTVILTNGGTMTTPAYRTTLALL